jgi:hypothetical protein
MADPLVVKTLAEKFEHIVLSSQASEHDLQAYFLFTEVGVAAVVREFPSAQMLANAGKDTLMSRGVSELNAVLLSKIAGLYSVVPSALLC